MTLPPLHDTQELRRAAARLHDTEMPPQAAELVDGWIRPLVDELDRARSARIVSALFAYRDGDCPVPFALVRRDASAGAAAYGAQFTGDVVAVRSCGEDARLVVFRSLRSALDMYGGDHAVDVVWLAEQFSDLAAIEAALQRLAAAADAVLEEADAADAEAALAQPAGQGTAVRDRCAAVLKELRDAVNAIPTPVPTKPAPPTKRSGEKRHR